MTNTKGLSTLCGSHWEAKIEQRKNVYVKVGAPEDLPWAGYRLRGMGNIAVKLSYNYSLSIAKLSGG